MRKDAKFHTLTIENWCEIALIIFWMMPSHQLNVIGNSSKASLILKTACSTLSTQPTVVLTWKVAGSSADTVIPSIGYCHERSQTWMVLKHIEAETKWPLFRRWHFQVHFLEWNVSIPIKISLKFVPKGSINNIPALVQIMAWRRIGDKPLFEPMTVQITDAYMRHAASMS